MIRASTRVDLPTPGEPVMPIRWDFPECGKSVLTSFVALGQPSSTTLIARARARRFPANRSVDNVSKSISNVAYDKAHDFSKAG